ncbi:hypothetical protein KJ567_00545 [Candidatus Bipolaricaulota bacterium]|nr:hypothetical protein [Candidatus Bipolaricaulota bacterium]
MRFTVDQLELGDPRLRDFVAVPWHLFRGDPHWTPPLRAELLGNRAMGITGLLTPGHPYHRQADVTHFIACDGRTPLGRVSAAINRRFNEHHDARIGSFGFFDVCDDYIVAKELLDRASDWLRARSMDLLRGPGGYSNATHEANQGVLIEGFDSPPTVELTHNPPHYAGHLERYGLTKAKDYVAYAIDTPTSVPERLPRLARAIERRRRIETQPIDLRHVREEVERIVWIYNEAWARNWSFLPLTDDECEAMADTLKLVADPGLLQFATVNGELAAVFGALPDPNVTLRPRWNRLRDADVIRALRLLRTRRRIPRARLMFFGVRPKFRKLGVDAVLYLRVLEHAIRHGYRTCEASMLLEDNDLILRASRFMGGVRYKTWRIYEKPLV